MKRPKPAPDELYQGLRGNQNAAKEVRREASIHARVTPDEKNYYIRLAHQRGLKLSEWMDNALKQYAKDQEENNDKTAD